MRGVARSARVQYIE